MFIANWSGVAGACLPDRSLCKATMGKTYMQRQRSSPVLQSRELKPCHGFVCLLFDRSTRNRPADQIVIVVDDGGLHHG